jgi:hypothetical protein
MLNGILARSIPVLLLVVLLPVHAWSQQTTLAPTLTQIVSGGEGIARDCAQPLYGTGLGLQLATPVIPRWASLQVAARAYGIDLAFNKCAHNFVPPPDGTYLENDRINLLSRPFITTDVRFAARTGEFPMFFAGGMGMAWHEGHDLPYLVLAAGIHLFEWPDAKLSLGAEYQYLRVTSDQFRRTYQDFALVTEESLGRVHEWSHAWALGVQVDIAL